MPMVDTSILSYGESTVVMYTPRCRRTFVTVHAADLEHAKHGYAGAVPSQAVPDQHTYFEVL